MAFGPHIDNAIRPIPGTPHRIRTDLSATLFLGNPDEYDGGELVIQDGDAAHRIKLPAGDMVLYPANTLHHVTEVTRGVRLAAFFWVQSLVRDGAARDILHNMDNAIRELSAVTPDHPALLNLTGCYHNLVRRWAEGVMRMLARLFRVARRPPAVVADPDVAELRRLTPAQFAQLLAGDAAEAARWVRAAARQGVPAAQTRLGRMPARWHRHGKGCGGGAAVVHDGGARPRC